MRRFFDHSNARGAKVYDVESGERLNHVLSIDCDTGVVAQAEQPLRIAGDEFAQLQRRYRAIHPIYGGNFMPVLFHCYGRQSA